jgi:hypothetical protein
VKILIRDLVTYGGQRILTIYHDGFSEDTCERKQVRREKIGRKWMEFQEESVSDEETELLTGWQWKQEGFLQQGEFLNPYGDEVCAWVARYQFFAKPKCMFTFRNNEYHWKLPFEQISQIHDFVRRYTGIRPIEIPMVYGDILICRPSCQKYHCARENEKCIVLQDVKAGMEILVNFKNDNWIVCSKKVLIEQDQDELLIESEVPWESHDLQIYDLGKLVYRNDNISYIRGIQLMAQLQSGQKEIPIPTMNTSIKVARHEVTEISHIGKWSKKENEVLQQSEQKLKRMFQQEKQNNSVHFISPDDSAMAVDILKKVLFAALDIVWVFDPYFGDPNVLKRQAAVDWIRVMVEAEIKEKHIFYYCKKNCSELESLKNAVTADFRVRSHMIERGKLNLTLYEISQIVHDRFVFWKKGDQYGGVSIGTSFNSLHKNYYCIHELPERKTNEILNQLLAMIDDGNLDRKEMI